MTQTPLAFMASDPNRRRGRRRIGAWLAAVKAVLLLLLSGLMHAQESPATDADAVFGYQLGPRDSISVTVFNHPDLSGEFVLDGDGRFSMPLIGVVDAGGKTPVELEEVLLNRFRPDYLVNPRISIEVRNYRPYFLIGEVQSTGSFPYVAGITYLTAIAMAGGYTYRAKKDVVYVIRGNDPEQEEIKLDANEKVQPGDIIRVAERLF